MSKESHSHTPFIVMEAYGFLSLVIKKKMKTLGINSKKWLLLNDNNNFESVLHLRVF